MKQPALSLLLEFTRSEQAADAFAFRVGRQEYLLRKERGEFVNATLDWNDSLLSDLEALRQPGRNRELPQRIGELLRRFVAPLGWSENVTQIEEATARGQRVILTLRSAAAELYALPWELLLLGSSGQHIAELPELLLRYEWPGIRTATATTPRAEGGRILFAYSAAGGAVPAAEQLATIREACQRGHHLFDVERDVLPQVSYAKLGAALDAARSEGRPIAVLHILCHGAAEGGTFGLCVDGAAGDAAIVDAAQLRQLLSPHAAMLQLVVLCACDSGNSGALGNQLGSVAQMLHRVGIAAVVASRHPLSVDGARRVCESLYHNLLGGLRSLESAILTTRRQLLEQVTGFDWASLQLYAHPADGDDSRPIVVRPFRGLLAFQPEHQRFFFGRERETAEIENDLQGLVSAGRPRLLIIAGASGSGKSSLVLAGAVPRLVAQAAARNTPLRIERVRAGNLEALANLQAARADTGETLVICDQFEEVFTHVQDATVRQRWVQTLWRLCSDAKSGISALLTMRVDFIGRCGELLLEADGRRLDAVAYDEAHRIFVAQLGPQQLETLIRAPAEQTGLLFEEGLVQRMLQDVGAEPGALPLLEYTLDLLWQRRQGRTLTQASYDAVGGVSGALHGHAEALLFGMEQAVQRATRRLLTRLVQVGDEPAQGTRRRVALAELRPRMNNGSFDQALAQLIDARLLVGDDAGAAQTIEIAHEALIRRWPRLVEWVREDRQMIAELEKIETWAKERDRETPLVGKQLDVAEEIAAKYREDLSPRALELVAVSQLERARQRRNRQLLLAGLSASTILFAIIGWFGWSSSRAAKRAEGFRATAQQNAESHARRAVAAEQDAKGRLYDAYVERARVLLVERRDPVRALFWLDRAYQQHHDTPSLRFLLAQSDSLTRNMEYRLNGRSPTFSPDGKYLLTEHGDQIKVYAVADGQLVRSFPGHAASFRADGAQLVVSRDGLNNAALVEFSSGKTLLSLSAPGQKIGRVRFSPDGTRLVSIGADGKLAALWSATDGSLLQQLEMQAPASTEDTQRLAEWSADGRHIVSSGDCPLFIWDGKSGKQLWHSELGADGEQCFATYSARGDRMLSYLTLGGIAQAAEIFDTARRTPLKNVELPKYLYTSALSLDGSHAVTVFQSEVPQLHDLSSSSGPQALSGAAFNPITPLFSPRGELVMTNDQAGVLWLWDVRSARLLSTLAAVGMPSVISPDGTLLVTEVLGGSTRESRVYDIARHAFLPGLRDAQTNPLTKAARPGCPRDNAKRKLSFDELNAQAIILLHDGVQSEFANLEDPDRDGVCFTSDGDYVVSWKFAASDSDSKSDYSIASAKIWDIETSALLTTLSGEAADKLVKALDGAPRLLTANGTPWSLRKALALADREALKSFIAEELPLRFQGDVLVSKPLQ